MQNKFRRFMLHGHLHDRPHHVPPYERNGVVHLSELRTNDMCIVHDILGGVGFRKKLFDMGILPGVTLKVVQGSRFSPFVIKAGDTKIMMGWGMLNRILVQNM